jgi:hypothetical protein
VLSSDTSGTLSWAAAGSPKAQNFIISMIFGGI